MNILFIDDHSSDKGKEQISSWKNNTQKKVQIIELNQSNEYGKKRAIKKGIDHSKDDWIFTLDADSIISKNLASRKYFQKRKRIYPSTNQGRIAK